jgi:hypothetical protein
MQPMYYIGLDVHKRTISYCVRDSSGTIHSKGSILAARLDFKESKLARLWCDQRRVKPWSTVLPDKSNCSTYFKRPAALEHWVGVRSSIPRETAQWNPLKSIAVRVIALDYY